MVQEQYPQEKASLRVRRPLLPFHHSHRNVQILISRRVAQLSTAPSQNSALYSFARSRQSGHPRRGDAFGAALRNVEIGDYNREALRIAGESPTAGPPWAACKRTRSPAVMFGVRRNDAGPSPCIERKDYFFASSMIII